MNTMCSMYCTRYILFHKNFTTELIHNLKHYNYHRQFLYLVETYFNTKKYISVLIVTITTDMLK